MVAIEARGQQNRWSVQATVRYSGVWPWWGAKPLWKQKGCLGALSARHLVPIRPHLLSAVCSLLKKSHWKSEMFQIWTQISMYLYNLSKLCVKSGHSSKRARFLYSLFQMYKSITLTLKNSQTGELLHTQAHTHMHTRMHTHAYTHTQLQRTMVASFTVPHTMFNM